MGAVNRGGNHARPDRFDIADNRRLEEIMRYAVMVLVLWQMHQVINFVSAPTLEEVVRRLPGFAKRDIAHDWCAQSLESRRWCASVALMPMDSIRRGEK